MTRTALLGVLALAAVLPGGAAQNAAVEAAVVRPNIVVFMTDDQTLGDLAVMPHARSIGTAGVRFDQAVVANPLCCPSRATYLTGQYTHNHGVKTNAAPHGGYEVFDDRQTLPVALRRSGYRTVHVGKYLNEYGRSAPRVVPPGWSHWQGLVHPGLGYYGYTINDNGVLRTYGRRPADYQTDVLGRRAVAAVRAEAPRATPYFLNVGFFAPHATGGRLAGDIPLPVPAPRHDATFASRPLPRPPSFNEADVSDKPPVIRTRPLLAAQQIAHVTTSYRERLESLLAVDEAVRNVLRAIDETGERDRTLVVFTSDNGFFYGEHRVPNGKYLVYEPSIRVPLLVRGPGVRVGGVHGGVVSNVDLAPTLLAAAGVQPLNSPDGISLRPLLANPGTQTSRAVLIDSYRDDGGKRFDAVRTARYVYVASPSGARELYDLAVDPHELRNRSADPAYRPIRDDLARRLARLTNCAGTSCR
jgi:N-acetylglucosamine-6-sulfatase